MGAHFEALNEGVFVFSSFLGFQIHSSWIQSDLCSSVCHLLSHSGCTLQLIADRLLSEKKIGTIFLTPRHPQCTLPRQISYLIIDLVGLAASKAPL